MPRRRWAPAPPPAAMPTARASRTGAGPAAAVPLVRPCRTRAAAGPGCRIPRAPGSPRWPQPGAAGHRPDGPGVSAAHGLPDGGQAAGPPRPRAAGPAGHPAAGLPVAPLRMAGPGAGRRHGACGPGVASHQPGSSLPLPLPHSGWSASQQAEDPAFPGSGWPAGGSPGRIRRLPIRPGPARLPATMRRSRVPAGPRAGYRRRSQAGRPIHAGRIPRSPAGVVPGHTGRGSGLPGGVAGGAAAGRASRRDRGLARPRSAGGAVRVVLPGPAQAALGLVAGSGRRHPAEPVGELAAAGRGRRGRRTRPRARQARRVAGAAARRGHGRRMTQPTRGLPASHPAPTRAGIRLAEWARRHARPAAARGGGAAGTARLAGPR